MPVWKRLIALLVALPWVVSSVVFSESTTDTLSAALAGIRAHGALIKNAQGRILHRLVCLSGKTGNLLDGVQDVKFQHGGNRWLLAHEQFQRTEPRQFLDPAIDFGPPSVDRGKYRIVTSGILERQGNIILEDGRAVRGQVVLRESKSIGPLNPFLIGVTGIYVHPDMASRLESYFTKQPDSVRLEKAVQDGVTYLVIHHKNSRTWLRPDQQYSIVRYTIARDDGSETVRCAAEMRKHEPSGIWFPSKATLITTGSTRQLDRYEHCEFLETVLNQNTTEDFAHLKIEPGVAILGVVAGDAYQEHTTTTLDDILAGRLAPYRPKEPLP